VEWKVTVMGILGLIGLYLVGTVFIRPLRFAVRVFLYFLLGIFLLILVNLICGQFGLHIAINPVTILTAGFLQVPGVILLVLAQYLL